jgi:hypothetical protein
VSIETLVAEQFIVSKLKSDSVLVGALAQGLNGIWTDAADVSAQYPLVQVVFYSGSDLRHLGNEFVWSDLVYIIRGCCQGASFLPLKTIAQRITSNLDGANGTTSDGTVFGCVRQAPFRMSESDGERQFRYLGGTFRIFAKES